MQFRCDNCGRTFDDEAELENLLKGIPDLANRLDPGGIVPSGTCPACGSLVYIEEGAPADTDTAGTDEDTVPVEGSYLVQWSVDVCAESFREAAERALRIQRRHDSIATVFDVTHTESGIRRTVDLSETNEDSRVLRCRVCGDAVAPDMLRAHLRSHNPNAEVLEPGEVRDAFGSAEPRQSEGPDPDWIDQFVSGAVEELADEFGEETAELLGREAETILREHE